MATINDSFTVQTPQGPLTFPDQATYVAWSKNDGSVAVSQTQVPGGAVYNVSIVDPVAKVSEPVNESFTVQTPQGALTFPNRETYNAWSKNDGSVAITQTQVPGGAVLDVSIAEPIAKVSEPVNESITVQTPQGSLTFPDQATYEAWSKNPGGVTITQTQVPGGAVLDVSIPSPVIAKSSAVDDYSNYTSPSVVSGPSQFTATATAANSTLAEELAKEQARTLAYDKYGVGTTQFTSFDEVKVKLNNNGTYTATYTTNALQVSNSTKTETIQETPVIAPTVTTPEEPVPNTNTTSGVDLSKTEANKEGFKQDYQAFNNKADWRVRLSLAAGSDYLYKSNNTEDAGILYPLKYTNGVIFPYTPSINVTYAANYDPVDVTHSNYKIYNYRNSSVDNITISCDFTAQDTKEANYLLAVIHFFRSVTKMFYGQDNNPKNGTPPPLCYLHGLGNFQFDNHPILITNFTYQLPNDCDYIRTDSKKFIINNFLDPQQRAALSQNKMDFDSASAMRLSSSNIMPGAAVPPAKFEKKTAPNPTYVPTKMQIQITAIPVVSRNDISNNFSLRDYGSGKLISGSTRNGSGVW